MRAFLLGLILVLLGIGSTGITFGLIDIFESGRPLTGAISLAVGIALVVVSCELDRKARPEVYR